MESDTTGLVTESGPVDPDVSVLGVAFTHDLGGWPWVDLGHQRPFLGIGILGGYITFATATLDMRQMVAHNHTGRGWPICGPPWWWHWSRRQTGSALTAVP
jgi:hypothetical protein